MTTRNTCRPVCKKQNTVALHCYHLSHWHLWCISKDIKCNLFSKNRDITDASHLSWVEGLHCITLHEEHVYKVDEDTRSLSGVLRREDQPLVQYHEHEVAKQAQQEQELREKYQVQVVLFPKVPVFCWQKLGRLLKTITCTIKGFSRFKKLLTNLYLQVIVSAEDHTEAHVYDTQYHWHLHLIGVQKCKTVGCQVPNLHGKTGKGHKLYYKMDSFHW